jgi:hypothetical protein
VYLGTYLPNILDGPTSSVWNVIIDVLRFPVKNIDIAGFSEVIPCSFFIKIFMLSRNVNLRTHLQGNYESVDRSC